MLSFIQSASLLPYQGGKQRKKAKTQEMCKGSPNVEEETGLVKMAPPNVGVNK